MSEQVLGIDAQGLLAEQVALYERLEALAREQGELIAQQDGEAMLELLDRRQRVIDGLARCVQHLEPIRERWESLRLSLPIVQRAEMQRLADRAQELAATVRALDDEHAGLLASRRDDLAGEIARLKRSGKAVTAYGGGNRSRGPSFRDERG